MTALAEARQLCRLRDLASDRALRVLGAARAATEAATTALAAAEAEVASAASALVLARCRLAADPANAAARLACHAAAVRNAADAANSRDAARDRLVAARGAEALARATLLRARLRADAMGVHTDGIARRLLRAAEELSTREVEDSRSHR